MLRKRAALRVPVLVSVLFVTAAARGETPDRAEVKLGPVGQAAVDAIKPLPVPPIPDNPPPHEGAMIAMAYVVEPPDILFIEVLEALPGRPVTGEHLVRPDGTISLGFYGNVEVRGLTREQIKVKVVERMRVFLPDEFLGLKESDGREHDPAGPRPSGEPDPSKLPEPPKDRKPFGPPADRTDKPTTPSSFHGRSLLNRKARPIRRASDAAPKPPEVSTGVGNAMTISTPGGGIKITIEVPDGSGSLPSLPPPPAPTRPTAESPQVELPPAGPADTDRVFVDVTSYNSKYYYVQGDVAAPGRMPITGNETVLDAINFAGGLIATSDPKNLRLVRPARGGKPARNYPIDWQAIIEKGDATANLQLFPGDRLVVGRSGLVQSTIAVDRVAAPYQTFVNSMLSASFMVRNVVQATPDLTPSQREALVGDSFDLFWKATHTSEGPADEKTLRELVLKQLRAASLSGPKADKK